MGIAIDMVGRPLPIATAASDVSAVVDRCSTNTAARAAPRAGRRHHVHRGTARHHDASGEPLLPAGLRGGRSWPASTATRSAWAVPPVDDTTAEIKRMYVRPSPGARRRPCDPPCASW